MRLGIYTVRAIHGCIMRTGYWTKWQPLAYCNWKLLECGISQKTFWLYVLCSQLRRPPRSVDFTLQ